MNLMRWRYWFFAFSGLFLIPGIISLLVWKLKPSIDFIGGSLLEIQVTNDQQISINQIENELESIYKVESIQNSGENQFIIRGEEITNEKKTEVISQLRKTFLGTQELRFEVLGPLLGQELLNKMLAAILLATIFITIYIWRQFNEFKYGVCAIIAMVHDILIVLGSYSLLGHFLGVEVTVLSVTAILTTLSFSVHDTIVVFDRIRELNRKHKLPTEILVNTAVFETMGRSLNNSMTIIFMLTSLVVLGGDSIRWFAVALLIGSITGTYSSTFVAVPLLLVWDEVKDIFKKRNQSKLRSNL